MAAARYGADIGCTQDCSGGINFEIHFNGGGDDDNTEFQTLTIGVVLFFFIIVSVFCCCICYTRRRVLQQQQRPNITIHATTDISMTTNYNLTPPPRYDELYFPSPPVMTSDPASNQNAVPDSDGEVVVETTGVERASSIIPSEPPPPYSVIC